jgi:hypothetical protein
MQVFEHFLEPIGVSAHVRERLKERKKGGGKREKPNFVLD